MNIQERLGMNEVVYTVTKFLEARYFVCKQTQGNVETSQKKKLLSLKIRGLCNLFFYPILFSNYVTLG